VAPAGFRERERERERERDREREREKGGEEDVGRAHWNAS